MQPKILILVYFQHCCYTWNYKFELSLKIYFQVFIISLTNNAHCLTYLQRCYCLAFQQIIGVQLRITEIVIIGTCINVLEQGRSA